VLFDEFYVEWVIGAIGSYVKLGEIRISYKCKNLVCAQALMHHLETACLPPGDDCHRGSGVPCTGWLR